jgi:hypothetical protein
LASKIGYILSWLARVARVNEVAVIHPMNELAHICSRNAEISTKRTCMARYHSVLLVISLISAIGCNKEAHVAHLQGKVTLNGRELPKESQAFVIFAPDGKKSDSVTVPVADGRYDSPKTPTGAVTAFFEINVPGPIKKSQHTGQDYHDVKSLVPAKFATGVPLRVEGDEPNRDFQLTD